MLNLLAAVGPAILGQGNPLTQLLQNSAEAVPKIAQQALDAVQLQAGGDNGGPSGGICF